MLRGFALGCCLFVCSACLHYQSCGTFAFTPEQHDVCSPSVASVPLQVTFDFDPAKCMPAASCVCDEIVFLQLIRISDPNASSGSFKSRFSIFPDDEYLPRQTSGGWSLDVSAGRQFGYYGMGDDGKPLVGPVVLLVPGNNGPNPTTARLHDRPSFSATVYGPNLTNGPRHDMLTEVIDAPVCIRSHEPRCKDRACRDRQCNGKILGYLYWRIRANAGPDNECIAEIAPFFNDDDYTQAVQEAIDAWNADLSGGKKSLPEFTVLR